MRYTLDGTTPSVDVGTEYHGPLTIPTTTALRAVAYKHGALSKVRTVTYIFPADVERQPAAPLGFPETFAADDGQGPYPADYAMDPEVVDDPDYTDLVQGSLRSIPSVSLVTDQEGLFSTDRGIYYNPGEKGAEWGMRQQMPIWLQSLLARIGDRLMG